MENGLEYIFRIILKKVDKIINFFDGFLYLS